MSAPPAHVHAVDPQQFNNHHPQPLTSHATPGKDLAALYSDLGKAPFPESRRSGFLSALNSGV